MTDRNGSGAKQRELAAEQGYVDWAYACLAKMVAKVLGLEDATGNPKAGGALVKHKRGRVDQYRQAQRELVIGRVDCSDGDTWYIGKTHVDGDGDREAAVIDWRAPVAARFYQARRAAPMGVGRRRTFKMKETRVLDMSEELLIKGFRPPAPRFAAAPAPPVPRRPKLERQTPSPPAPRPPQPEHVAKRPPAAEEQLPVPQELDIRAPDLVLDELARERTGELQEVLATIQADQDRLIRAPIEGTLVIQGGPGTGKTIVGLHRAAYVLYEQRQHLTEQSVLVVGPNHAFLGYIRSVLPSLGETNAHQATLADLALLDLPSSEREKIQVRSEDDDEARRVKGDARMSRVVPMAVWVYANPLEFYFPYGRFRLALDVDAMAELVATIRDERVPYQRARGRLRAAIVDAMTAQYAERTAAGPRSSAADLTDEVRGELASSRFLERVLPDVTPRVVVERLLTDAEFLDRAASGILRPAEQRAILRKRAASGRFPWSADDLPLVAEAVNAVTGESRSYGHVVVDEAQDLSPLQWLLLFRRSIRRSMTILGDLAQATSVYAIRDWRDFLGRLGLDRAEVGELTIGYRVPKEVIEYAARLLPTVAPDLVAPTSIRSGAAPMVIRATGSELPDLVLREAAQRAGQTAIIVAHAKRERIRARLVRDGVDFTDGADGTLDAPVVLLSPEGCKGLEFDHVIVVEPRTIAGRTHRGTRLLYVALTRATTSLTVVHSDPLPKALSGEPSGPDDDEDEPDANTAPPFEHDIVVTEPLDPAQPIGAPDVVDAPSPADLAGGDQAGPPPEALTAIKPKGRLRRLFRRAAR